MPIDRSAIDRQLRDIGENERWWEHREFRDLPHVLTPDERILGLVRGRLLGPRRLKVIPSRPPLVPTRSWLFVATSQRLICLRRERFGRKQSDLRPGQVTRVRHGNRIRTCLITLDTAQGRYRIRIPKRDALRFLGALAPLVPHPVAPPPGAGLPTPASPALAAVAAIPGLAGLVSKVTMLTTPPEYASRDDIARLETTVERLETELARLQQQVDFLEDLLRKRAEATGALPAAALESE
ncbi:MAG TPA: hypothetical protein VF212_16020 [Longimicrobiales bacterium]